MDDDWDDGPSMPSAPSYQPDSGSHRVGKGRGFDPVENDDNGFGGGGDSFASNRGGRGGGGGGGFGRGGRGGDRGGRGGDRGGRGGSRFGDDDRNSGRREGDWTCPDSGCGNSNFGWRQQCQKCNTDKPEGAGSGGGGGGRGGRGGRYGDSDGGFRGGRGGGRFGDDDGGSRGGRGGRGGGRGRFDDGDSDRQGGGGRYGFKDGSDDESGGGFRGRGGGFGGRGRGGGRGESNGDGGSGKPGDWTCPDSECGNNNFAFRQQCQKCNADKPAGLGGDDKPRPELYIPPEPVDDDDVLYGGGITSGLNFEKYFKIPVKVTGNNIPEPVREFTRAGLRPFVIDNITKSGYTKPTPIQQNAIPIVMAGRDLMACAQTGSGKTAAFLIPIVNTLLQDPVDLNIEGETCEPQVVIVSPTRELAIQIFNEARKFSKGSILKVCIAYGGTGTQYQASKLVNGCHILVATPGRLNDFVERGRIAFGSTRFFVLDEADRMLDMGFLDDMKKMLSHSTMVPTGERQTLMFSATFPDEIQQLAGQFLHDYLFAAIGIVGGACTDVEQTFFQVSKIDKRAKLKEILTENEAKVLVFVETKRSADFIACYLSEQEIPTTSIHGDRQQREREQALNDFTYNRMRVLVATAVAARGLDIKGVAHVINYDLPKSIDEYVHRIGRTGRVGNRGKATSFFDSGVDGPLAPGLVKILQQASQPVPDWLESDSYGGGGGFSGGSGFGGRDYRKNEFNSGPQPQAAEADEEW